MAAAYGLYSHIQSNKRRSIALLLGLFFLVYLMVFAGALAGEALYYNASLDWLIRAAWRDTVHALPWATGGTVDLGADRLSLSPDVDRCRHRRTRGDPQGRAAALQSSGKSLHLARHPDAEAQDHGRATRSTPSRAASTRSNIRSP